MQNGIAYFENKFHSFFFLLTQFIPIQILFNIKQEKLQQKFSAYLPTMNDTQRLHVHILPVYPRNSFLFVCGDFQWKLNETGWCWDILISANLMWILAFIFYGQILRCIFEMICHSIESEYVCALSSPNSIQLNFMQ